MHPQVFIINPDTASRHQLRESVQSLGYQTEAVTSIAKARERFRNRLPVEPALVIVDVGEPDTVDALMEELRQLPFSPPVLISANAKNLGVAAAAIRLGATDFIVLPVQPERLQASISNALKISALQNRITHMSQRALGQATLGEIVATSPAMQRVLELVRRAAASDLPVLLEGEKGAGKEMIARAIHQQGALSGGPFVKICICAKAGLTDAAVRDFASKAGEAAHGVLFIDDITETPPAFQEFLLSLFSVKNAQRPRVICATRNDLIARVKSGQFMEKLFYRLNVFPISVPPLRKRTEDFCQIIEKLIVQFAAEQGKYVERVDAAALQMLKLYSWPGNLVQLENAVYRAVALADGQALTVREFPQIAARVEGYGVEVPAAPPASPGARYDGPAMIGGNGLFAGKIVRQTSSSSTSVGIPALNENGDIRPLTAVEADMIRLALGHYRGHMTEIARKLGIGRSTLYRKIREFGIGFSMH